MEYMKKVTGMSDTEVRVEIEDILFGLDKLPVTRWA